MNTYLKPQRSMQLVRPMRVWTSAVSDTASGSAGERAATKIERTVAWRDLIQSFAHDIAETPVVSRLLAAQVVLALGGATLYAARALRRRTHSATAHSRAGRSTQPAHRAGRRVLAGATIAGVLAFAWAALAFISRTRAAPAVTAIFVYGNALRHYFPPRTRAA